MEAIARKRFSIYLIFIVWGIAVSMMHPGFAMMVASIAIVIALMALRFVSHIEGQIMMKIQEAKHAGNHAMAAAAIWRQRSIELAICVLIALAFIYVGFALVKHAPWLWFSISPN